MADASASPIATQETVEERVRSVLEDDAPNKFVWKSHETLNEWAADTLLPLVRDLSEALSASEKRNEELVRERDEARRALTDNYPGPARKVWAAIIEMAQTETRRQKERAEAAESRLASLTGLVGDMREKAAKVAERCHVEDFGNGNMVNVLDWPDGPEIARAIRALELPAPAVSTTGEEN